MSQYELADTIQSLVGNSIALFVAFVSIVSAYAIVAYLAGVKLHRSQIILVNSVYLLVTVFLIFSQYGLLEIINELSGRLVGLDPEWPAVGASWTPTAMAMLWTTIVIGSLKFMWDIRSKQKHS